MKLGIDEFEAIADVFLDEIEENLPKVKRVLEKFKPVLKEVLEELLEFGPVTKESLSHIACGIADIRSAAFKRYLKNGFTREEALSLVMNEKFVEKIEKAAKEYANSLK
jgi:hypothetical protein